MKYSWTGWFDGEGDSEPPEPGKHWLEIHTIEDDDGRGEEIAVIVHRGVRRVIPCTCGTKTIQPEGHKIGCPFRGSGTTPIFDFDDRTREQKEKWAQEIVAGLNALDNYETVKSIARQVLGHAYPAKTFDELTPEEIERVAYNLKWADEALAEVMPIVAANDPA